MKRPFEYCGAPVASRSRFPAPRRCFLRAGHAGPHHEFPYLAHLTIEAPRVADKIIRDSVMTTGAAWKSKEAGPNRILRWAMLLSDEELLGLGIDMSGLQRQVVAKLREKAATYDDCMKVAHKLTALAYGMRGAPKPPEAIREYLEDAVGQWVDDSTACLVCLEPLSFELFDEARRGKAAIETAHRNPRFHTPENVGFAHRACNIAQGNKTLDEFYDWIARILQRASEGQDS